SGVEMPSTGFISAMADQIRDGDFQSGGFEYCGSQKLSELQFACSGWDLYDRRSRPWAWKPMSGLTGRSELSPTLLTRTRSLIFRPVFA
ncbi:MAG TPA: hypothetical protein VII02_13095, partial [Gemmatimonadaceae bacterium]